MSDTLTTAHYLAPGTTVVIDGRDWVRVTATEPVGRKFRSTVAPVGAWGRRWVLVTRTARAARYAWQRRVWWPAVDWAYDRWEAWRRR